MCSGSPLSGYQILVMERLSGYITNTIAVLITSTTVPIFNLVFPILDGLATKFISNWQGHEHDLSARLLQAHGFLDLIHRLYRTLVPITPRIQLPAMTMSRSRTKTSPRDVLISLSIALAAVSIPISLILASIFSAGLVTNAVARSISNDCGVYTFHTVTRKAPTQFLEFEHKAESQAASYAEACYGRNVPDEQCNRFPSHQIPYHVTRQAKCPFWASTCVGGDNSAYQLSTGLISAAILGVNAATSLYFGRTMTCSPLPTDDRYVKKGMSKGGTPQHEYMYGTLANSDNNLSYFNPVQRNEWDSHGYSVEYVLEQLHRFGMS